MATMLKLLPVFLIFVLPGCNQAQPRQDRYCIQVYQPVCGVDGKTWSNACMAGLANVKVKHKGECHPQHKPCPTVVKPVCGYDGRVYINACVARRKGVKIRNEGRCPSRCLRYKKRRDGGRIRKNCYR